MAERHRKEWTVLEDDKLAFWWGVFKLKTIAERLDRTQWAVATRARNLKLGPACRGQGMTLRAFCRHSGYSTTKIKAVAEQLEIPLRRIPNSDPAHKKPKRPFLIPPEDQAELLRAMLEGPERQYTNAQGAGKSVKGLWGVGRKPPSCVRCGSVDKDHYAKGQCKPCYVRQFKVRRTDAAV
jgi:hypothetical protein